MGRNKLILLLTLELISFTCTVNAQKTELRAVWVATVSNLDWPTGTDRYDPDHQKASMMTLLDSVKAWNLNAIFLQVRPRSDAFYPSNLAPWSQYLTGSRGKDPGYDPLQFAIDEAHKRGIELHAWLNPYRYSTSTDGLPNGVYADNPHWLLAYEDERILNPGHPEVIDHIKDIVREIINNYDVDGIHFDDYFYPYSGTTDEDIETFNTFGAGFGSIGDWRRNNVTTMVKAVSDTINSIKPHIRYGVSPFGIYGNGQNPPGILGLDAYNFIFTDPMAWLDNGSIDYICPQLYWPTGGDQDFETLLHWWSDQVFARGRHVIAGHGIYRLSSELSSSPSKTHGLADPIEKLHELKNYLDIDVKSRSETVTRSASAWTLSEIVDQIDIVRSAIDKNSVGSAFFRYEDFIRVQGLADRLREDSYMSKSVLPSLSWKDESIPDAPVSFSWEFDENGISYLQWNDPQENDRYIVYTSASQVSDISFFDDPANIADVIYGNSFVLDQYEGEVRPYLYVNSYNRYGTESKTQLEINVEAPELAPTLVSPVDEATNQSPTFDFQWTAVERGQLYVFQLTEDPSFSTVDFEVQVRDKSINAYEFPLLGDQNYYWRVIPLNLGGNGPESEIFTFHTGFPSEVEILSPAEDEQDVQLSTSFLFANNPLADQLMLQLAKGSDTFQESNIVYEAGISATTEYQLPIESQEYTTYHLKVSASNALGTSGPSYRSFRTLKKPPGSVVIFTPLDGESRNEGEELEVKWGQVSSATGYQIVLSEDPERVMITEEARTFFKQDTTYTFSNLQAGTYYINVSGTNLGGNGEWTQITHKIDPVLSLKVNSEPEILAFQNTDGCLTVLYAGLTSPTTVSLVDFMGKIYRTYTINDSTVQPLYLDVDELKGVFVLKVDMNSKTIVQKLVLK